MRSAMIVRLLLLLAAAGFATPGAAQTFPPLSGRVVDAANLLDPAQEAALTGRLEALEQASSRQLVVATIPDLEGHPIEDYGHRLGREWKIGQAEANNGTILLVAPNDRKVRIEVGYGLEPILTDALSHQIIQTENLPRFRQTTWRAAYRRAARCRDRQLGAPPRAGRAARPRRAEAQRQEASEGGKADRPWG